MKSNVTNGFTVQQFDQVSNFQKGISIEDDLKIFMSDLVFKSLLRLALVPLSHLLFLSLATLEKMMFHKTNANKYWTQQISWCSTWKGDSGQHLINMSNHLVKVPVKLTCHLQMWK